MEEKRKIAIWVIPIVAALCVCIAMYYFFTRTEPEEAPLAGRMPVRDAIERTEPQEAVEEQEAPVEPLRVPLDESDPVIRDLAHALTADELFAACLESEDLVRKFVAAVDNIANGLSPRAHVDFFHPEEKFKVIKSEGIYYIDPASYRRYDALADAFFTMDTNRFVTLYKQAKPVIQEAYAELGYPGADFNSTFQRAIVELLKVPVVEEDPVVIRKVLTFILADPELEKLSASQKHLLRMGPDNVRLIQGKLREIADAMGFPEDELPW